MYISKNPARSRPLSANVKRLMRLARASPQNAAVIKFGRKFSIRDLTYCSKQGALFMEAAFMGLKMEDFAPTFMTSQIAGIFDVFFTTGPGGEGGNSEELFHMMQIPLFLKSPKTVVETLYWIDDIVSRTVGTQNKSLVLTRAYEADTLTLPSALKGLPSEPNRDVEELTYAYWLGYIYRCECLMHEESSRMVYGAFPEPVMRKAYEKLVESPLGERKLSESAVDICAELDRFLVETLWPEQKKRKQRRQEKEVAREKNALTGLQNTREKKKKSILRKGRSKGRKSTENSEENSTTL